MASVRELVDYIEKLAPSRLRCEWDNDGLQVCRDADAEVEKCLFALDVTDGAIDAAIAFGADVIVTHHPLIFKPLRGVTCNDYVSRLAIRLLDAGITQISAHTRLDIASGGVNDVLASLLGLENAETFGEGGVGRIGFVKERSAVEFASFVKETLGVPTLRCVLSPKLIGKVAIISGAGKDDFPEAVASGADAYVTGDVMYNMFVDAKRAGMTLIDAGHYYTEFPICRFLESAVEREFPEVETAVYEEPVTEEM